MRFIKSIFFSLLGVSLGLHADEATLNSPDGRLAVVISDQGGLHYRVAVDLRVERVMNRRQHISANNNKIKRFARGGIKGFLNEK